MGRGFFLRPLENCVNGENQFSRQRLVQHKTYHQLRILEPHIPVKRSRRESLSLRRARSPPHHISPQRETPLGTHSQRYNAMIFFSSSLTTLTSPDRDCVASCPKLLRRVTRYTIFNVSKLTPAGAAGVFSFMSSNASTTRSATTRFRYHFRLAGTMYQGACSVLVAESTSSNTAM